MNFRVLPWFKVEKNVIFKDFFLRRWVGGDSKAHLLELFFILCFAKADVTHHAVGVLHKMLLPSHRYMHFTCH